MNKVLEVLLHIEIPFIFISYGLIFYQNTWIYYSLKRKKYPFFPFFLNPLSINSYKLLINSMFTFSWNERKGDYKNLKRNVNILSKFLGFLFLTYIFTLIIIAFTSE